MHLGLLEQPTRKPLESFPEASSPTVSSLVELVTEKLLAEPEQSSTTDAGTIPKLSLSKDFVQASNEGEARSPMTVFRLKLNPLDGSDVAGEIEKEVISNSSPSVVERYRMVYEQSRLKLETQMKSEDSQLSWVAVPETVAKGLLAGIADSRLGLPSDQIPANVPTLTGPPSSIAAELSPSLLPALEQAATLLDHDLRVAALPERAAEGLARQLGPEWTGYAKRAASGNLGNRDYKLPLNGTSLGIQLDDRQANIPDRIHPEMVDATMLPKPTFRQRARALGQKMRSNFRSFRQEKAGSEILRSFGVVAAVGVAVLATAVSIDRTMDARHVLINPSDLQPPPRKRADAMPDNPNRSAHGQQTETPDTGDPGAEYADSNSASAEFPPVVIEAPAFAPMPSAITRPTLPEIPDGLVTSPEDSVDEPLPDESPEPPVGPEEPTVPENPAPPDPEVPSENPPPPEDETPGELPLPNPPVEEGGNGVSEDAEAV